MSIFDVKQVKNKPNRSSFDLSQHNLFTARLGQLTPVMFRNLIPGDEVNLDISSFTQTSPINTNAFARIKEHFDVFFVPYRLLYSNANNVIMDNVNLQVANTSFRSDNKLLDKLPYTNPVSISNALFHLKDKEDCCGQNRYFGSRRLLHYLGYGDFSKFDDSINWQNEELSIMPLAAYQKIYADFYRFSQWEDVNPYTYNFNFIDSVSSSSKAFFDGSQLLEPGGKHSQSDWQKSVKYGSSILDLRYVNYNKDFLFGILPSQVADVYINPNSNKLGDLSFSSTVLNEPQATALYLDSDNFVSTPGSQTIVKLHDVHSTFGQPAQYGGVDHRISVLSLRAAYSLQKWSEVQQFSDNNYKSLVKAHFGIDVPDYTAQMSEYLGGTSSMIQINDVVNQNLAVDGASATRQAYANGVTDGHVHYTAKEHGVLMLLYHADPVLDYDSSDVYDPQLFSVGVDDFPKSEFDSLGLEPVYNDVLKHDRNLHVIGYAPRYWSWKSVIDYYKGAFCHSMKNFVIFKDLSDFNFESVFGFKSLSYSWFKVHPSDVDSIFVAQAGKSNDFDGDQFYVNSGQKCIIKRSLSYTGMPY